MPQIIRGKKLKKLTRSGKGPENKEGRRIDPKFDRYKRIRLFSYAFVLLMAVFTLAAIMAVHHYRIYPGRVERDSISSPSRGSDYIVLSWDGTQNTDVYKVWVRERDDTPEKEVTVDNSWRELETANPEIKVDDLEANKSYSFIVRADNGNKR